MPTAQKETRKPGEQVVVTEGGVRKDGQVFPNEAAAQAEVERRRKVLQEQAGGKAPATVETKQQLFG